MTITIPGSRRGPSAGPLALCAALLLAAGGCGAPQESPPADAPEAASPPAARASAEPAEAPAPEPDLPQVDPGVPSSLPGDVPVPEGATAQHEPMEDLGAIRAAFRLDDSPADVRGWYQQALRDGGWALAQEREIGSDVLMAAQKEERMLTIAITDGGEFTNLMLVHHRGGS